jgi:membrane protein YdbS with pleckstrin-like domain
LRYQDPELEILYEKKINKITYHMEIFSITSGLIFSIFAYIKNFYVYETSDHVLLSIAFTVVISQLLIIIITKRRT